MDSALDILEIRTYIAAYLSEKDIRSCRLVNKEWTLSFAPFFWQTLSCRIPTPLTPVLTQLAPNACHIQTLSLSDYSPPEIYTILQGKLPRLRRLNVNFERKKAPWGKVVRDFGPLPDFLKHQCSSLWSLKLERVKIISKVNFWKAVADGCQGLKTLEIDQGTLTVNCFLEMWRTIGATNVKDLFLSHLEVVGAMTFHLTELQSKAKPGQQVPKTKVQKMHVAFPVGKTAHCILQMLIGCCPDLQLLGHSGTSVCSTEVFFQPEFCKPLAEGTWKDLDAYWADKSNLEQAAAVIKAMPRVKELKFPNTDIAYQAMDALQAHKQGLVFVQVLDLYRCRNIKSFLIQRILEEAVCLVELKLAKFESKVIVAEQHKPWKCASTLKRLQVEVQMSRDIEWKEARESVREETRLVLGKIATLTRLESLTLGTCSYRTMQISLENGFEQLETLTELRTLDVAGIAWYMKEPDLEWVVKRLPKVCDAGFRVKDPIDFRDPDVAKLVKFRNFWIRAEPNLVMF